MDTHPSPDRRSFLRGAGVALALPLLEGAAPSLRAAEPETPRRLVVVCACLGFVPDSLVPRSAGRDYDSTPYLDVLKDFRDSYTFCSGMHHPDVGGGHGGEPSFLTGAPHPGEATFHNSVSLDQFAVERLRPDTRFPSLVLSTQGGGISVNASGVQIPPETSPSALFAKLFLDGKPDEVERQAARLRERGSVLDAVRGQAKRLGGQLGAADRDRLDQYFTAVREVERGLANARAWAKRPKPRVAVPPPRDIANMGDVVGRTRLMLDLAHLAIQTDSTRFVTLKIDVVPAVPPIEGVTLDHHNLSHHGKDPDKLRQLRLVELGEMGAFRDFLAKLRQSAEAGGTLLDRTSVLLGSNLGNASSHDNRDLPAVLAGGGFKHGRHLAFDRANNEPLCRLYVSLLQRLGVEADAFGSGKGHLSGLEMA